jgi:hypothetical protein
VASSFLFMISPLRIGALPVSLAWPRPVNAGRRFHHRFSRDDAAGSAWDQSAAGVISPALPKRRAAAPGGQKPGVLKRIGSEIDTE